MKEPTLRRTVQCLKIPYSEAPVDWLQRVVAGTVSDDPGPVEFPTGLGEKDHDFRRRYAAILLRERGL